MDGCYYSSNGMSVILNPNSFSDTENGTVIGMPIDAWTVVSFAVSDWALYPNAGDDSSTAGSCDDWRYSSRSTCLYCGGYYSGSTSRGLFYVASNRASNTNSYTGFRVIVLP